MINYEPIGVVRSDFKSPDQSDYYERDGEGIVEVFSEYERGLKDIEKHFSHVIVVYHMHMAKRADIIVRPFNDPRFPRIGVFASGGPFHPNPIGVTPCRILKVERNKLYLKGLDAMNGSPVLDIKPYSPQHYTVLNPRYAAWEDEHHGKEPKDRL